MIRAQMARWARRKVRRGLGLIETAYARRVGPRAGRIASAATRALAWVRRHESPSGGIYVHSRYGEGYPEVTGYLIPTLLQYGERDLAARLVRWLVCVQRGDGAFTDPNEGQPNVFDTGQALRGLLAGVGLVPQALDAARRAAEYLCAEMQDGGRRGFGPRYRSDRYRGEIPETIHLYALPPLCQAAEVFQEPRYRAAAERCCDWYRSHEEALRLGTLTHYLAYELEALIDLGHADLATPVLDALRADQRPDGGVRGAGGATWVCAPGLAQLAVCWYKLGQWEPADRAMRWLEAHQEPSGGWLGSYGEGAPYFADGEELSWAAKFFLDAHRLRVRSYVDRAALASPAPQGDWIEALLSATRPGDRVLDVGCGTGRTLRALRAACPGVQCYGIDLAASPLARVPAGIPVLQGSVEAIPCADETFDVTCSVRAVEHAANLQAAVSELVRVTRPGGWVVIVHAQRVDDGRSRATPWRRCPDAGELARCLRARCDRVTAEVLDGEGPSRATPVVVWRGHRRPPLPCGALWHGGWTAGSHREVVHGVMFNRIAAWAQAAVLATRHGERVLVLGRGAGETSLHIARAGRTVTVVAPDAPDLAALRACARQLGLRLATVLADGIGPPAFADNAFDCVVSLGLLERIAAPHRRAALRSWARMATRAVVAVTAGAACPCGRANGAPEEERGLWPCDPHTPVLSLREDFEAAGLRVRAEYAAGGAVSPWSGDRPSGVAEDARQAYVLVTVGTRCL